MFRFSRKLRWVKRKIKEWNKRAHGNIFKTKDQIAQELKEVEERIQEEGRSQMLDQIERDIFL